MMKCEPVVIGRLTISSYNEHNPHDYLKKLESMDTSQLFEDCKDMIWFAAYAYNNRLSDFHWMREACMQECKRRNLLIIFETAQHAVST